MHKAQFVSGNRVYKIQMHKNTKTNEFMVKPKVSQKHLLFFFIEELYISINHE